MSFATCPTDIVHASPADVWSLVADPSLMSTWVDATLTDAPAPPRLVQVGDRLRFGAGPWHRLRVTFEILSVEAQRELAVDVHLPFGVINHEVIMIRGN